MESELKSKIKDEIRKSLHGDFSLFSVLRVLPLAMEMLKGVNIRGIDKRRLVIDILHEVCGGESSCVLSKEEIGVIVDGMYNSWLGVYNFSRKKGCCC